MMNSLILGITAVLFNFDVKLLKGGIKGLLNGNNKSEDLVEGNNRAIDVGYEYACQELKLKPFLKNKLVSKISKKNYFNRQRSNCKSSYFLQNVDFILHIQ